MKLLLILFLIGGGGAIIHAQTILKPLAPKFAPDPQVYNGRTPSSPLQQEAGDIAPSSTNLAENCPRNLSPTPSHTLTITKAMSSLSMRVFAPTPITLTLKGKEGITCRTGMNPEIIGAWSDGKYQIWISTPNGEPVNYQLSLSETSQPLPARKK